jgi:hypothetical protein
MVCRQPEFDARSMIERVSIEVGLMVCSFRVINA